VEEEAGAGTEEEEGRQQRRGGGRGGDVGNERRRGEEIRWEVGCWAALMGLFFNSRPSGPLFFFS
jgi:hypothetical protein